MQVVSRYPDGVFSWVDLATTDPEAAKKFYGGLFGWSFLDMPTDSGNNYSMAQIEGYNVAGLGPLDAGMQQQGVPPFWSAYVNHDDVDSVAARAADAGGTVMFPPFDVMDAGRMIAEGASADLLADHSDIDSLGGLFLKLTGKSLRD